jgi:hypothetical protein
MTWVAMHIGLICFVPLACFVLWRSARFGLRFGPQPKPKPQMTPWHPELGRRKAISLLVFYLFAYSSAGLFFLAWAMHGAHRF